MCKVSHNLANAQKKVMLPHGEIYRMAGYLSDGKRKDGAYCFQGWCIEAPGTVHIGFKDGA